MENPTLESRRYDKIGHFHIVHAKLSPKLAEIENREKKNSKFSFVGKFLTVYFTVLYKGFCEGHILVWETFQKSNYTALQSGYIQPSWGGETLLRTWSKRF